MNRRRWLLATGAGLTGTLAGATWWLRGEPAPIAGFNDLAAAREWLQRVRHAGVVASLTAWSPAQVVEHLAQSIEYSMIGYPQAKPAWFQASLGRLAGAAFQRAGAMQHDLEAPIPGAPTLAAALLAPACDRLQAALDGFEAHTGLLQPHFAYGVLSRDAYLRAHLMPIADHAAKLELQA